MKKAIFILSMLIPFMLNSCLPEDELNPDSDDPRDKIIDTWNCTENSPTYGESSYMVDISIDETDSTRVILSNFYALGTWSSTYARLSNNTLTISSQEVEGHQISGQGVISGNSEEINWNYEVTELNKSENSIHESVTAVYTR